MRRLGRKYNPKSHRNKEVGNNLKNYLEERQWMEITKCCLAVRRTNLH